MRVIEPKSFKSLKSRKKLHKISVVWFVLAALVGLSGLYAWQRPSPGKTSQVTKILGVLPIGQKVESAKTESVQTIKPVKTFTGEQFKQLYRSIAYPNTQLITDLVPITGNVVADARIRRLAEARGYRMASIPVQSITKIPGLEESDNLLQPLAFQGWLALKATADQKRIPLTIISAYRSPQYQRQLFLSRLLSPAITIDVIAAGQADSAISATLHMTAVPGYSRHHTGYTVDFGCRDGSKTFASSGCFRWLNNNNYQNSKEHGWIPSYPSGTSEQGPEPEPWEYVWVGRNALI